MTPIEALENLVSHATEHHSFSEPEGTDVIREALRRDWSARVLDAWLATYPKEYDYGWEVSRGGATAYYVEFCDGSRSAIDGPWDGTAGTTPDDARLAAARAVFPSFSAKVRAELGECP